MLLWSIVFQLYFYAFGLFGWVSNDIKFEVARSGLIAATLKRMHYPLIAAVIWTIAGFVFHAVIIRSATGAVGVRRSEAPDLYKLVENLAITAGLPMPRIEIMETEALNAYAAGLTPSTASIAVTRGLVNTLDKQELEAVLAHEITHIRNYDTRMKVIATVLSGGMCMLAERIWRHVGRQKIPLQHMFDDEPRDADPVLKWRDAKDSDAATPPARIALLILACIFIPTLIVPAILCYAVVRGFKFSGRVREAKFTILPPVKMLVIPFLWPVWFALLVVNVFLMTAYVIAAVARSAISRSREFLADAGAVELTKNPHALVSALAKVANHDALEGLDPSVAALMISAPSRGWLASHPSIEERIAALQSFAGAPMTSIYQRRNGAKVIAVAQPEFGKPANLSQSASFGRRRGPSQSDGQRPARPSPG